MIHIDPDELPGTARYAQRRETTGQIVLNRVAVTGSLFATALAAAFALGRPRA